MDKDDSYLTIAKDGNGVFRDKMSRFISFASEVTSVEQAKNFIKDISDQYHDARHVCWAYMIGGNRSQFLSSDNGEPSGTAGKPILGQINSFNLTDVVIAVVRYFGGIKLGPSGLINAYRTAARMAIEDAGIVTKFSQEDISFTFSYMVMNDVMKIVKKFPDVKFVEQLFDNVCKLTLRSRVRDITQIRRSLIDVEGVSIII